MYIRLYKKSECTRGQKNLSNIIDFTIRETLMILCALKSNAREKEMMIENYCFYNMHKNYEDDL